MQHYFCQNYLHRNGNPTDPLIVNGGHQAQSVSVRKWLRFRFSVPSTEQKKKPLTVVWTYYAGYTLGRYRARMPDVDRCNVCSCGSYVASTDILCRSYGQWSSYAHSTLFLAPAKYRMTDHAICVIRVKVLPTSVRSVVGFCN